MASPNLTVALILRLVDRLSAPGRAATRTVAGIAIQQKVVASASGQAASAVDKSVAATKRLTTATTSGNAATRALAASSQKATTATQGVTASTTASALAAGKAAAAYYSGAAAYKAFDVGAALATASTSSLTGAVNMSTTAMGAAAAAAYSGAEFYGQLARSEDVAGRAAETAARKMSLLRRGQLLAGGAMRSLKVHADELQSSLNKLAMASIATEGLDRAGQSIMGPIERSVRRDAQFQRSMTGIGILGDLSDKELAPVRSNIFAQAQRLALPADTIQQDDMAILNEGVYRGPSQLIEASRSAAGLSLLADIGGSPVSGAEAGALISTYAHALQAPAEQLEHYNAVLFRASQLGGDKIGDVARFMPTVMAQMKGRAFGNFGGFVDAAAAFQIVKRVAGTDEAAGVDLQDLMANLSHRLTVRRFEKAAGVDLNEEIAKGVKANVSPLQTVINILRSKVGDDPNDPRMAGKLGQFFMNQQASQAALALLQYTKDSPQGIGFDTLRRQITAQSVVPNYQAAITRASTGPAADLQRAQNAKDQLAVSTGTILRPATKIAAWGAGAVAGAMTTAEQHGGIIGKGAVYGVGAIGLAAMGVAGLGKLAMGVLAPMLIMKQLTGKMLPDLAKLGAGKGMVILAKTAEIARGAFSGLWPALTAAGRAAVLFAAQAVPAVLEFSGALMTNPVTWIVLAIVAAIALVAAGAYLIWKNWKPISAWFAGLWTQVKSLFAGFVSWLGELPAKFGSFGRAMLQGLVNGFLGMAGAVKRAIFGMGDNVVAWFKGRLGIHSPSRVFADLGRQTIAGLNLGLDAGAPGAVRRAAEIAGRVANAAQKGLYNGHPVVGGALAASMLAAMITPHGGAPITPEQLIAMISREDAHGGRPSARAKPPGHAGGTLHVEQHFHGPYTSGAGAVDHRKLAQEMHRHAQRGLDAALHDGGDDS